MKTVERETAVIRELPAYERTASLRRIRDGIAARRDTMARTLTLEAGKPIAQALVEIDRPEAQ